MAKVPYPGKLLSSLHNGEGFMALIGFAPVLHVVGFLAAIAVYAMLLVMVWRIDLTEAPLHPDTPARTALGALAYSHRLSA